MSAEYEHNLMSHYINPYGVVSRNEFFSNTLQINIYNGSTRKLISMAETDDTIFIKCNDSDGEISNSIVFGRKEAFMYSGSNNIYVPIRTFWDSQVRTIYAIDIDGRLYCFAVYSIKKKFKKKGFIKRKKVEKSRKKYDESLPDLLDNISSKAINELSNAIVSNAIIYKSVDTIALRIFRSAYYNLLEKLNG